MEYMCLSDAPYDTELKVLEIRTDIKSKIKLSSIGIHVNDHLVKLNGTKWGPVLVQNVSLNSSKLALGRPLAKNIIVESRL